MNNRGQDQRPRSWVHETGGPGFGSGCLFQPHGDRRDGAVWRRWPVGLSRWLAFGAGGGRRTRLMWISGHNDRVSLRSFFAISCRWLAGGKAATLQQSVNGLYVRSDVMRLVTYRSDGQARVAGLRQGAYVDLKGADPAVPVSIRELLAQGPVGLERAARALATGPSIEMEASVLLPPIPDPRKVICVGANYADHARESGMRPPSEPVIFNKFPTTIRKDGDPIVLPRASRQVDYEAELVVVMGRGGRRIAESEA
ncbi:MAG TPA: hypothetical protein EYH34_14610, partial [Planctomycetes bacterium]|nr:hypothetical protein [Planctomycetota bacterium]